MPSKTSATAFQAALSDRVKWARQAQGMTQAEAAEALGLHQDHYKHFEKRRPLPPEYVEAFCKVARIDANWLFTGHGRAPVLTREEAEARMPSRPRKVKRKSRAA